MIKKKNSTENIKSIIFILILSLSSLSFAESDMSDFLKSCGYGAIGGALAGVVSLAFTDKPGEQLNNISKGASLGLYFGIGYGLYKVYGRSEEKSSIDYHLSFLPDENQKNLIPALTVTKLF